MYAPVLRPFVMASTRRDASEPGVVPALGARRARLTARPTRVPPPAPEPLQVPTHHVELKLRLLDAVSLARVHDHRDGHVAPFERRVELVALRDGDADVVLTMLDERRGGHPVDVEHGGTIAPQVRRVPKLA